MLCREDRRWCACTAERTRNVVQGGQEMVLMYSREDQECCAGRTGDGVHVQQRGPGMMCREDRRWCACTVERTRNVVQ